MVGNCSVDIYKITAYKNWLSPNNKFNNLSICNLRRVGASHWTIFAVFLQVGGGPFGTVPELLFEKKGLITEIQRMLVQTNTVLKLE